MIWPGMVWICLLDSYIPLAHEFASVIQYNIRSFVNKQYDANGPVDRRETSTLLMSTCPITGTFNVIFNVIQKTAQTAN